jgi:pimeloyl-ACP methyl ester carboxylesterase
MACIDVLIPRGFSLFCFDFSGSGHSDGEYVTLGSNESDDLKLILESLKSNPKITGFGLWGRSMGAVTALLYILKNQGGKRLIN